MFAWAFWWFCLGCLVCLLACCFGRVAVLLDFVFVAVLLIVWYIVILVYIARLCLRVFNWCWFDLVAVVFDLFRCFVCPVLDLWGYRCFGFAC